MGKNKINQIIGYGLFGVAVILGILIFRTAFSADIWYDEVFSLEFVRGGFKDIINLTSKDVHPPLYYMYLKACSFIFGGIGFEQVGKIASLIPYVGIMIISVNYVRKRFGEIAMGLFSLLVTAMPQLSGYYVEIRMYSFALFWLTMCFVMLIDICTQENAHLSKWVVFCISGIIVAYTQYFACIAVIALYMILFINGILVKKCDKKYMLSCLMMVVASIVLYTPWLFVLKTQLSNVAGSYWILPMTLRSIPGCIKYIFLPVSGEGKIVYVAAALMIAITAVSYLMFLLKKPSVVQVMIAMTGPLCLAMVVGVGFIFSAIGSPIFTYRYMVPALGVFYLGVALVIVWCKRDWLVYVAIVVFAFGGRFTLSDFFYQENMKAAMFEDAKGKLALVEDDSIIITNFDHITALSSYYFQNGTSYIYEGEVDAIVKEIFDGCDFVNNEDVKKLVCDNDHVYFFGSFVSRDEIVDDWSQYGIQAEYIDECMIERYWFNIYRLSSEDNE